jgi:hypothetical protein
LFPLRVGALTTFEPGKNRASGTPARENFRFQVYIPSAFKTLYFAPENATPSPGELSSALVQGVRLGDQPFRDQLVSPRLGGGERREFQKGVQADKFCGD